LQLKQLEYVIALAETSSFTSAARRCDVTQSVLSYQIARLEEELGTRLFERTTRSVRITERGLILLARARMIIDQVTAIKYDVESLARLHRGRLRIGTSPAATRMLDCVRSIGMFHNSHPGIRISVRCATASESIRAVAGDCLDVGICEHLPQYPEGITFHELAPRERLVAVVSTSHPLAGHRHASLAELAESGPFIESRAGSVLRRRVDDAFHKSKVDRTIELELGLEGEIVQYVAENGGAAIVPHAFIRTQPGSGRPNIDVLHLDGAELTVTLGAYTRKDGRSAAADAFVRLLIEESSDRPRMPRGAGVPSGQ
jgi:DNA-binding transcriptional LysR family regulator